MPVTRKTLLFVTRLRPETGGGGSGVYANDLLKHLAENHFRILVLLLDPNLIDQRYTSLDPENDPLPFEILAPGYHRLGSKLWSWKGIFRSVVRKIARLAGIKLKVGTSDPMSWGQPLSGREAAFAVKAIYKYSIDVVICNYCWLAEIFKYFSSRARKIVLTHDVWSQHVWRDSGNNHLRQLDHAKEQYYLSLGDAVVAITEVDAAVFREMLPEKKIVVASMSCAPVFSEEKAVAGRLLFVGSIYEPNVNGINWFLKEVGPALESRLPGYFEIHIVGGVCAEVREVQEGIKVVKCGLVPELDIAYRDAEMVVIPLLQGTGLKIKLVEAIAHGKVIVTTSVGARGIEILSGSAFRVANNSVQFAESIIELSTDQTLRRKLRQGARDAAVEVFSPAGSYRELLAVLEA